MKEEVFKPAAQGQQDTSDLWQSQDAAANYAQQHQQYEISMREVTRRMLEAVELMEGFHVLDVASGPAAEGLLAARAVGPTGTVLAIDISDAMLEQAVMLAKQEGVTNITTRVMDANQLELADQSFDAVISRLGLNLLDRDKAFSEILRVLKPQRKLAALIWSTQEHHPFVNIPTTIMERYVTLPTFTHDPFALGAPGVFAHALTQAGFSHVSVEPISLELRLPSMDVLTQQLPIPIPEAMEQLSLHDQQRYLDDVRQAMQQFVGPQGELVIPTEMLLGVGTR